MPWLISQLFESNIFIQIRDQNFQTPRDVFSLPGNMLNHQMVLAIEAVEVDGEAGTYNKIEASGS